MRAKKLIVNVIIGVTISVIAIVIAGLVSPVVNKSLSALGVSLLTPWQWIVDTSRLSLSVPVWLISLFGMLVLIEVISWGRRLIPKQKKILLPPAWMDYTDDIFAGLRWRWEYRKQGSGWMISDLTCYCPEDDSVLILIEDESTVCPICSKRYETQKELPEIPVRLDLKEHVTLLIEHKLRTTVWETDNVQSN